MLDLGVTPLCELMSPLINGGCVCACMCKCVCVWGERMHACFFVFLPVWPHQGLGY